MLNTKFMLCLSLSLFFCWSGNLFLSPAKKYDPTMGQQLQHKTSFNVVGAIENLEVILYFEMSTSVRSIIKL